MRIAIVFPGQGSQHPDMLEYYRGSDFYPTIQKKLEDAAVLTEIPFLELLNDRSPMLDRTTVTQPLLLTHALAIWSFIAQELQSHEVVMAGHSLGELTAVTASGLFSFEQAVIIAKRRAELMQEAMPQEPIGMTVVLGTLSVERIESIIAEYDSVWLVNDNCDGQVVLGGLASSLILVSERLKQEGAKRVLQLPMSVVSHCGLLQPALESFQHVLNQAYSGRIPFCPIFSNWTTTASSDPYVILERLAQQLTQRVRFREMIAVLAPTVDMFIEVGSGQVLSQLIRKITSIPCYPTHNTEQLQTVLAILKGAKS